MPVQRTVPDTDPATMPRADFQQLFEAAYRYLRTTTLTSSHTFVAFPLVEEQASVRAILTSNLAFIATPRDDIEQIFDAIHALCRSTNTPRDRQIADRLTDLRRAASEGDEYLLPASLTQLVSFFRGER